MGLPINNLHVSEILSVLDITSKKARDIFYKSNGALRSELELSQVVNGILDGNYCADIATLRNRRNLASFKGYESFQLALSASSKSYIWYTLNLNEIVNPSNKITVYSGGANFSLSSNNPNLSFIQEPGCFYPYWNSGNEGLTDRTGVITVSSGSQSKQLHVLQTPKPFINNLPSHVSINYTNGIQIVKFPIETNSHEWQITTNNNQFFGYIEPEVLLFHAGFNPIYGEYGTKYGTLTISRENVNYTLNLTAL
jgi:hypothetical protein